MRITIFATFAPLALGACTIIPAGQPAPYPSSAPIPSTPPSSAPSVLSDDVSREQDVSLKYAALGQSINVNGPKVTPVDVLEDSRCPMNARCVWAGQVRLRIRLDLGPGPTVMELTSGTPVPVADGNLELVDIRPDKLAGAGGGTVKPAAYRFGFRFVPRR